METRTTLECAACSAPLLDELNDKGVVTTDGTSVPFRRHTDRVVCSCFASYRVSDLRLVITQVEERMRSNTLS